MKPPTSTQAPAGVARVRSALFGSPFARGVSILAGGNAFAQGLVILAAPFLTRLYSPADLGLYAVFLAILAVANSFASMRYERAIPLPKSPDRAESLVLLSVILLPISAALFGAFVWVFGDWMLRVTGSVGLAPYVWLFPFGLASIGAYNALSTWFVREGAFKTVAWTRMVQSGNMIGTQLLGGLVLKGPLGLLFGGILGQAAGVTHLLAKLRAANVQVFSRTRLRGIPEVAVAYSQFPAMTAWTQALNAAGLNAPSLLLASFYGPEVAGWYVLSQRVLAQPMGVVSNSVSQVYFSQCARLMHTRPSALPGQFLRLSRRLVLLSLPIGIISLIAPWLFGFVFGEHWRNAGIYAAVLGLAVMSGFVAATTHNLVTYGFNTWSSLWEVARLGATAGALWMCARTGVSSFAAIAWLSGMSVLSYSVLWVLNWVAVRRASLRTNTLVEGGEFNLSTTSENA